MDETDVADSHSDTGSVSFDDDAMDRYRINAPEEPKPTKRRREDAAFLSWVSTQDQTPRAYSKAALAVSASEKTIHTPREYQLELFERAKDKNTIVVLDTGSGKTLIAALLLRHTLDIELERRSAGEKPKIAFFLVEKVALCFQQHAVLCANLQHPIGKLYGDNMGGVRTKEEWDAETNANMAFVCTAQILLDLLNHGFIHMSQVNLLVFDEAHHTKKSHPFARIIRDHYMRCKDVRPRILGMTASPVDAQTRDLRAAALELETNLASEISTVSDEVLMQGMMTKCQVELTEHYDRLLPPDVACTNLWTSIHDLVGNGSKLHLHLEATKEVATTLGAWCVDRYWKVLMTESEVLRQVARSYDETTSAQAEDLDGVLDIMGKVRALVMDSSDTEINRLSPKFRALSQILEDAFTRNHTKRCIVFVQKRFVAYLLADAFAQPHIRIPSMVPGFMVGSQTVSSSIANNSIRDQIVTLQRFRVGEINCLFATPVAEEGIDVPDCDLIIRFDLCDSAIQYIQSKGRARQDKSTYISMLENGNMTQKRRLMQATRDANAVRKFCSSLPADRKIQEDDTLERELVVQKVYEIPETGARLTFTSSQEVLAKFVSSLTNDSYRRAEYVVSQYPGKKFVSTIIFPDCCPMASVHGSPQRNKMLARSSAAFEASVQLIRSKHINEHLQPTFQKKLPAMRNARLAISANKRSEYTMRCKPDMWSDTSVPGRLYGAVLSLTDQSALGRKGRPLVILTRNKLPYVEPTVLHFGQGVKSTAQVTSLEEPIVVDAQQGRILTDFTLTVFKDVFSKGFAAAPEDMPYYFAPCADRYIDWELVAQVSAFDKEAAKEAGDLSNRFVTDHWDGSRKFVVGQVEPNLRPFDRVPEYAPNPKSLAYKRVEPTIAEYSNSLSIKARQRVQWKQDQLVYEAELLSLRRNFLDENTNEESYASKRCVLILEPLDISALPVDVASMAMILPVMLYRIESVGIVMDACTIFDLKIEPTLALEAMTKDSTNTDQHGKDQIDFQGGMGRNYERLEFLGDSFLKMATTISLFTLMPEANEFESHVERMLLICNQNLFNHAVDRNLQEYVRSKAFNRSTWYPNLTLKSGRVLKTDATHSLGDKSIADVCEALIGAAYMTNMDLAVEAVSKMVCSKNHAMTRFSDYYDNYTQPEWQDSPPTAAQRFSVDAVERVIGYRFTKPALLRSAFKHPSYPYEHDIPNYQRLEFLGDSLLDLAVVDHLYKIFPEADPQWMTEHKMAMVSNKFFACVCVELGLHKHLTTTSSAMVGEIATFAREIELAKESSERVDFWTTLSLTPKALSDVVEAVVGAMFEDSGFDYTLVTRFFERHILPYFENMDLYDTYVWSHPVAILTRLMTEMNCTSWRMCVTTVPGEGEGVLAVVGTQVVCALMVHQKAFVHAVRGNARDAKMEVAKMALEKLRGLDEVQFREVIGCTC